MSVCIHTGERRARQPFSIDFVPSTIGLSLRPELIQLLPAMFERAEAYRTSVKASRCSRLNYVWRRTSAEGSNIYRYPSYAAQAVNRRRSLTNQISRLCHVLPTVAWTLSKEKHRSDSGETLNHHQR